MSKQAVGLQWISSRRQKLQILCVRSACGRLGFPAACGQCPH